MDVDANLTIDFILGYVDTLGYPDLVFWTAFGALLVRCRNETWSGNLRQTILELSSPAGICLSLLRLICN